MKMKMKMKLVVLWVWFLVMFLATSADTSFSVDGGRTKASAETRKLKEESYQSQDSGKVKLDDYHPPDPPPSSGVITSGPIEYGTPLMPHIPKPKPGGDSNNNATYPPSPSPVQSPLI